MRSIPIAMCWEMLHRNRWLLAAAATNALAFPAIILGALAREGGFDRNDPSMLIMQLVMIQLNGVLFGSALIGVSLTMSRLYAYPASTATLVTWRLLPAVTLMAAETVAWTLAINAMFGLNWPLWGPAMLGGVAIAAVIAAVWLTAGSRWIIFALTIVGAVLGLWFKSRYGSTFGQPMHSWDEVTTSEVFTLLAMAAIAGGAAYLGLQRVRHGGPPFSLGIVAWLERALDRRPSKEVAFESSVAAQSWYAWRRGWLMPTTVIAGSIVGFIIWLFASRDGSELVTGVLVGSRLMMLIAVLGGAVFGNLGSDKDLAMSQFLATRPICNRDFARINLRMAASSLVIGWLTWGAVAILALGLAWALSDTPPSLIPGHFDWRELAATFLGSWVIAGGLSSILLTGRSKPFTLLLIVGGVTLIALMVLAKFTLSPQGHANFLRAIACMAGVACVLTTIGVFAAARRRELINAPTAWTSLATVAAFIVGAMLMLPTRADLPLTAYALVIGLLTLTVAPLAAAPLAVALNRHR